MNPQGFIASAASDVSKIATRGIAKGRENERLITAAVARMTAFQSTPYYLCGDFNQAMDKSPAIGTACESDRGASSPIGPEDTERKELWAVAVESPRQEILVGPTANG